MTPEQLVDYVCALYSRYDVRDNMLRYDFRNFLRQAHSTDFFRRDLAKLYILNPTVDTYGNVSYDFSQELQSIRAVKTINQYMNYTVAGTSVFPTDKLTLNGKYRPATGEDFNYYGFRDPYTYTIFGNNLSITDVSTTCKALEIEAFTFPSYAQNEISGAWETNSWILEMHPGYIQAIAEMSLAYSIKDAESRNSAMQKLSVERSNFLATYVQDIVSWQQTL